MPAIASLFVRIGAQDQEIQKALASIGEKAKSLDVDLKKLGGTSIGAQAQKSLETMRSTIDQITQSQTRLAERAKDAARGIEQFGGASALTNTQLKQVNKTLQEGLSAYHALGQEAPAELKKVADAVKGSLDAPLGALNTKIIALGTAIGNFLGNAALQVGRQLVEATKASFQYADSLSNLSVATGVTTQGLQRLEAIGITSGVSMDTLANSIEQMQKRLDDPAAIKALHGMGLDYKAIRDLAPEQQFLTIAKSIAAIEDPVERMNAGVAVFGRTWSNISPAIQGDIQKVIDATTSLSDAQIKALDAAGDKWDLFQLNVRRRLAAFLGDLVDAGERAKLSWQDIFDPGAALRIGAQLGRVRNERDLALPGLPKAPGLRIGADFEFADTDRAQRDLDDQIAKSLSAAERFKSVQDQLFGRATIDHVNELVSALGGTENLTKLTASATKKLHDEVGQALDAYNALGQKAPAVLKEIFDKTNILTSRNFSGQGTGPVGLPILDLPTVLPSRDFSGVSTGPTALSKLSIPTSLFSGIGTSAPQALVAALAGGGNAVSAVSATVGNNIGSNLVSKFGESITKNLGKTFGGAINAILPGLGAVAAPLINLVGKLFGKSEESSKVSPLRDAFFKAAGGLEHLNPLVQELTGNLTAVEDVFKAKTVEGYNAAMGRLNDILAAGKQKVIDLQAGLSSLGDRLGTITTLGPGLKDAIDRAMNTKSAKDLERALQDVTKAAVDQQVKFDRIKDTLSKYGLAVSEAGKPFKQEVSNQTAVELRQDFDTLRGSGVDVNHVIAAMRDNLNKFIKDAKAGGLEVPESFREIIQVGIDAGEIYDENGKKITDMKELGLTFGTTMDTVMKKTIPDAIAKLTTVLEGLAKFLGIKLPDAAEAGAEGVQDALDGIKVPDLAVNVTPTGMSPDELAQYIRDHGFVGPDQSGGLSDGASTGALVRPWGLQHLARGGFAGDTVPAMLTPGELVLNAAQQKNVGDALGGQSNALLAELRALREDIRALGNTVVQIDGREVLRAINRIWDNGGALRTQTRELLGVT